MKKVAFPTEDGKTISQHFGQAPYYVVATLKKDEPASFEKREKTSHTHHNEQHDHAHGHDHASMFASISDCQVLICGGMGEPAYEGAISNGLQVILTGEKSIETALDAFQSGKLETDLRRVHKHGPSQPFLEI